MAPAAVIVPEEMPKRKANFFERKRFVEYEQNTDSQHDKSKEQLKVQEEVVEEEVQVFQNARKARPEAVKSKAPAKKAVEEKPAELFEIKEPVKEAVKETKKEPSDKDDYEDNWDMSDNDL